jgi:2-polyprenyl-3-methyl-5-hydroxy-6-metoxy-1,4-benzoquinol methylase/DNA-directed RNA polymerase subunit RPC12/RpoP
MLNIKEYIRCPYCINRLSFEEADCKCLGCGKTFPIIAGIPDLRVPVENDWIDFEEDRLLAITLADKYDSHSFEQLVAIVWNKRQNVPPEIVKKMIQRISQGAAKFAENLTEEGWIGSQLTNPAENFCIELGCGTGSFLEAAIPEVSLAVGIDISLAWLVVTKKRLEEKGLNGAIVCACIEHLPFEADQFDFAVAFDVIEHVINPNLSLKKFAA